jgi:AcrR family transcriptional regulator
LGRVVKRTSVKRAAERAPATARAARAEGTRAIILDAAFEVLSERGYNAASVDEIAARASVSRPTFYAYFSDKFAVTTALSDRLEKEVERGYRKLCAMGPSPGRGDLIKWITKRVAETQKQRSYIRIFSQASAAEPSFYRQSRDHRVNVFAMLGETFPAFRAASRDASGVMGVRAHMLFDQLELVCSMIALDGYVDPKIAIDLMAEQIQRFMQIGGELP